MNNTSVLKSKLVMPELSDSFLLTERIRKLHKKMDSCKAVTLYAPAGYGKTTLAVSYFHFAAVEPFRVCWYRLDAEDRNLSVFTSYLMEMFFPSGNEELSETRKAVEDIADEQMRLCAAGLIICHEMWAHQSEQKSTRTYVVLDDFQNVAPIPEICDVIRYMLDNLPPSCSIFILNRANSPVFSEKQKLENKIIDISSNDLIFSRAEIEDLMDEMAQPEEMKKLTGFIQKNTEGWIAGIIILCQAFKNRIPGAEPHKPAGFDHEDTLFRYLSNEVFRSVDDNIQDALARLSLIQDFSEGEASEIFQIENIKSLMGQCLSFGMFIQVIPGNPVVYRFHSLFREFLQTILKSRYTKEQIEQLHINAAGYYTNRGTYTRAAEHIIECGRSEAAMNMVTNIGFNKFLIGDTGQLKLWLDLLPEEMIRENPVLLMFKAQLMPNSRQREVIEPLKKILEKSRTDMNPGVYYQVSTILIYIFMCGNDMDGLVEMATDLDWMYQAASEDDGNTYSMLDLVRFIGEEQYTQAEMQSESIVFSLLPEDSQWLYSIVSCINYYCLGKLEPAERCMEKALNLSNFRRIEPAVGFILLFLTNVLSLKNEKDRMAANISRVFAIGEKYNYEYLCANAKRLAAFERYIRLDTDGSVEMLDYADFYYRQMGNKIMAAACRLLRRLWRIQNNSLRMLLEEARKDFEIIRDSRHGMMVVESSLSILGAIAREAGDYEFAEHCLLLSISTAREKKGHQVVCGSLFHLAKLYYTKGDAGRGRLLLTEAMELASENRYFMFWDIHIPTLVEMALISIRCGYCAGFAEELLKHFFNDKTVLYLREKAKNMEENLIITFVNDFLQTFQQDKCEQHYFVKANLFGKPEIFVNGVVIPESEWKTRKVKGFLMYLLLNSGNTISKELLTEFFWPETGYKAAIASQRTALYYVRKILSKYQVEVTGNNAFIYETLEGLQIRKNDSLELDIHEFLRLNNEMSLITDKTPLQEEKQARILEHMLDLYKGELMEGIGCDDIIYYERERFKTIFVEACRKLSAFHIKQGNLIQAEETLRRAMATEPYNENICLELLELYKSQGRRSQAVKVYNRFKKNLEQELDIQVDERLTEVIRSIKKS